MTKEKQIIRVEKSKNYSVISNEFLRRDDLSWKAKGIMAYLLTLPDDWTIYTTEIMKHATDGRDGFRKGWNELKKAGYIETRQQKEGGKFGKSETIVHELPLNADITAFPPRTEKPATGKPLTEKPATENPPLLNTYLTKDLHLLNTDLTNNNTAEPANAEPVPDYVAEFNDLWKIYPKGRKQGKDKAKSVYIRERKKKNGPSFELVKSKLLEYIKQIEVKHTQPQFIKQGGTWFNQHGWADEYDLTPEAPKPSYGKTAGRVVEPLPDWAKPGYVPPKPKPMDPEKKAKLDEMLSKFISESDELDRAAAAKNKR